MLAVVSLLPSVVVVASVVDITAVVHTHIVQAVVVLLLFEVITIRLNETTIDEHA